MAPKAAQEKAKKKANKQKKLLIILVVAMLGALVYAYTTMSSLGGKAQVAATPAASAPADATPTGDATDAPVTPGIAASAVVPLGSFVALGRKDPFNDRGPKPGTGSGSSSTSSTSSKPTKPSKPSSGKGSGGGSGSQPKPPSVPLTGAVISINGKKLSLAIGAEFGQAPGLSGVSLFRLEKVTKTTALIDVVGTTQSFTLHVKKPLTLQQTGGWTYTLILEPLGSAAPMTVQPTTTTSS
jgi:hypothetical protein